MCFTGFNAVVHKEPVGKVIAGPAIAKVGKCTNFIFPSNLKRVPKSLS